MEKPLYIISKYQFIAGDVEAPAWKFAVRHDGWSREFLADYGNADCKRVEADSIDALAKFLAGEPKILSARIRQAEESGTVGLFPRLPSSYRAVRYGVFSDQDMSDLACRITAYCSRNKVLQDERKCRPSA